MDTFFYGLTTGAVLSVMLGTVFFALIQNSIEHGIFYTMFISMGVIVSDIIMIVIAQFNAELIPPGGTTEMVVRLCGAIFLIVYGVLNIMGSKKMEYPQTYGQNIPIQFTKGFLLNGLNPGNFIAWLAISTQLTHVFNYSEMQQLSYYSGALVAIFGMELLISFSALWLKQFFTERLLSYLNKMVGIIFIGFAIYLLLPVFSQ